MLRTTFVSLFAIAASGMSGAALDPGSSVSQQALAALDPTRLGRLACSGQNAGGATLEQRLRLAEALSSSEYPASAAMPLLAHRYRTAVPATGLTDSARAYFDQGMSLAYGFNHAGALRSFREAQRRSPDCAMCWWGEALVNGPNINAGMDSEQNRAALAALVQANRLGAGASPLERELIAAQALRYSAPGSVDQTKLDAAYADAMLAIAGRHPDNDDVAILAAEAAMNTAPWNYWDGDKKPVERIGPAIALVETVMARNPGHPQARHLYIHLMENSADPHKGVAAADELSKVAPQGFGHLIHMPGHIYYRVGRYADSMRANVAAAHADEAYLAEVGDDGPYRYGYYPHNVHFLLTSAQMVGDMKTVATESERLKRILDVKTARALPWVQAIHAAPAFALAQYASPEATLALTDKPSELAFVEAMRRYARAVAFAEQHDARAFAGELAAMDRAAASSETKAMVDAGFPAPDIIRLAALVARGRAAHWNGQFDKAVGYFEQAEAIEKTIPYSEPPYWYYPVAQSRGAALWSAGRYEEAREAFRKALFQAPNDGWALYGLKLSEEKLGHGPEASAANAALKRVWLGDPGWLKIKRL